MQHLPMGKGHRDLLPLKRERGLVGGMRSQPVYEGAGALSKKAPRMPRPDEADGIAHCMRWAVEAGVDHLVSSTAVEHG